jgi:crotonobetainyl-CoA:carnitine CoA-transferase CaiB-like acyl-CoA transferase
VTESPYLAVRNAFVTLAHPDAGTHGYMTLPFRFSRTPVGQHRASPCLGADTRKILTEIAGLSAAEVDELDAAGVTSNIPVASNN